ncbi:hypothetical protein RJ640_020226 [Escallonia rubra]|uniref:Uncharacterized protein n=1 Tax=Escallonia rubra TaxID=112253 RepID=A0AA88UJS8_9ASTE|nr:hypothetical protein RJ640_020226 [Escallonia rubra]
MAIPSLKAASLLLSLLLLYTFSINPLVQAQLDGTGFQLVTTDALQWQSAAASVYGEPDLDDEEQGIDGGVERRSLYWSNKPYYISYGALSANRIPCPARSGSFNGTGTVVVPVELLKLAPLPYNGTLVPITDMATER